MNSLKKFCELCIENDVDWHIAEAIYSAYFPLLENAHRIHGDEFNRLFWISREGHNKRMFNAKRVLLSMGRIRELTSEFTIEERAALSLHLEYLAPIEGMINPELGFLIWTLIANGAEFNIRNRNIKTYEGITRTTLGQKIRFLKDGSFFPIIYENIDVDLRNSVGHMFYDISDSGEISVEGRRIEYERVYRNMREIGFSLNLVLYVFYERFRPRHIK